MQLTDRGTDNPDQRIAQDLALFVDSTLSLRSAPFRGRYAGLLRYNPVDFVRTLDSASPEAP
jgi:hypothetical protein